MLEPGSTPPVRRVLVLAPNWLGDVVMAAPLLTFLRDSVSLPEASSLELILGIRRAWAPLFENDPRLDGILVLERNGLHRGVRGLWRQAQAMRSQRVDAVLLGPPSLRAALTARLAGIPLRVGFRSDGRNILLSTGLDSLSRGSMHYSWEMLQLGSSLAHELGFSKNRGEKWNPASKGRPDFACDHYLPGCSSWVAAETGQGPPLWALSPGTTFGQAKTWPAERVGDFLKLAVLEQGRRVVLLGDASSREFCQKLKDSLALPWREDLPGPAGVVDQTGKTDLPGVVRLLKASEGFVGNDSGLMHLAGALGLPTVGIFGSSNPDWTAPAGPMIKVVAAEGYSCRPCYRPECNQPHFCLGDISARQVLSGLLELLPTTEHRGEG